MRVPAAFWHAWALLLVFLTAMYWSSKEAQQGQGHFPTSEERRTTKRTIEIPRSPHTSLRDARESPHAALRAALLVKDHRLRRECVEAVVVAKMDESPIAAMDFIDAHLREASLRQAIYSTLFET